MISFKAVAFSVRFYCLLSALFCVTLLPLACSQHKYLQHNQAVKLAVARYASVAKHRLQPLFHRAQVSYPPKEAALIVYKKSSVLELWACSGGQWRFIRRYPLLARSGHLGPKLLSGDGQIPEGLYRITALNPYSHYHLSMHLNYPNSFDRHMARLEGRNHLGGDIFIHGGDKSIGCLAIGDSAIESLFVLFHRVGLANVRVIISPQRDLLMPIPALIKKHSWFGFLYQQLYYALRKYHLTS